MPAPALPRVGYLGPQGTFSEQALLDSAAPDAVEPVPLETIYEAVMALRRGELRWAIVPIENSLEGSISVTLDLLAAETSDVEIAAEALLRVTHCLIAGEATELAAIDTVLSHPQVLGQCALLLRGELAHARTLAARSSADAVRTVTSEARAGRAAIGTSLAAQIYGGTILRAGVEDRDDNQTRFAWVARAGERGEPPLRHTAPGAFKTSLVFWGAGADRPGWLVRCLDEFASRDINLTRIESRPRREGLGSYMFFVDLSGHVDDAAVADAIAGASTLCEQMRVLGCYRVAPAPDGAR